MSAKPMAAKAMTVRASSWLSTLPVAFKSRVNRKWEQAMQLQPTQCLTHEVSLYFAKVPNLPKLHHQLRPIAQTKVNRGISHSNHCSNTKVPLV